MSKPHKPGDNFLNWAFETMTGIDIKDLKAKQDAFFVPADPTTPTKQPQQFVYENLMFRATTTRLTSRDRLASPPADPKTPKTAVNVTPSTVKSVSKPSDWKVPLAEVVDVESPDIAFPRILQYAKDELERAELEFLNARKSLYIADGNYEVACEDKERAFLNKRRIMRTQQGVDPEDPELIEKLQHMRFDAEERVRRAIKLEKQRDEELRAAEDAYEAAKRERAIALRHRKNSEAILQEWYLRRANAESTSGTSSSASSTMSRRSTLRSSSSSSFDSPCPKPRRRKARSKAGSKGEGKDR